MENSIIAAGAIMNYLKETMHNELNHICSIKKIDNNNFMWLDGFTIKNLELIYAHNGTSLLIFSIIALLIWVADFYNVG